MTNAELVKELVEASDALVGAVCTYSGGDVIIPCGSHGDALRKVKSLRDAITKAKTALCNANDASLLPKDVVRLVIAARIVAFEDQGEEALQELGAASEAFADRIPWDGEEMVS